MNPAESSLPRSFELMSRQDTALLVVDMQEKLLPHMPAAAQLLWNVGRLVRGAKALGLPVYATEQYPQGLGPTAAPLLAQLGASAKIPTKLAFSSGACGEIFAALRDAGVYKVLVCGIETHVCVAQTVHDLLGSGFRTYVAVDGVAARHGLDHEIALRRLDSCGATLTTVEAALFEWCEVAGTPEFKIISGLVKESPPVG